MDNICTLELSFRAKIPRDVSPLLGRPANRTGLQMATVRNLLLAWVLTLPASMLPSGSLFWLFNRFG